jgi:hypothetical protein
MFTNSKDFSIGNTMKSDNSKSRASIAIRNITNHILLDKTSSYTFNLIIRMLNVDNYTFSGEHAL